MQGASAWVRPDLVNYCRHTTGGSATARQTLAIRQPWPKRFAAEAENQRCILWSRMAMRDRLGHVKTGHSPLLARIVCKSVNCLSSLPMDVAQPPIRNFRFHAQFLSD